MVKKIFILLFILISISSYSQNNEVYKDKIILKNGYVFVGMLIDYNPGQNVNLKLKNGNTITLNEDEVKNIIMYDENSSDNDKKHKKKTKIEYSFKSNTFYNNIDLTIIPSSNTNRYNESINPGIGINYTLGYRYNNFVNIGLGTGLHNYYYGFDEVFIPFYFDYQSYLLKEKVAPYIRFQGGYSTLVSSDSELLDKSGGAFYTAALGFKFQKTKKLNFTMDFAFQSQHSQFVYFNYWTTSSTTTREVIFKKIVLRFGLLF